MCNPSSRARKIQENDMNTKNVIKPFRRFRSLLVLLTALGLNAQAATTDLSNVPLATSSATAVLPNVLFLLDDSGSMAWTHMPDESSDGGSSVAFVYGFYGLRSNQCNGVYYDPTYTYVPPVKADGTSFPNATFTSAWTDGFAATGSVNLSSAFKAGDVSGSGDGTAAAAYYYKYSGTQTTELQKKYHDLTSTFNKECASASGAAPGSAVFTKVIVNGLTGPVGRVDERQNFANWYSYYRTRMLTMKSAAGLAFKPIDNNYRVGFLSLNDNTSGLLNLATFDAVQKAAWYAKFYASTPSGSTPLRDALADAGRLYAHKYTTLKGVAVVDPIQYSCQQNFTILSTDGYWNQTGNPKRLDNMTDIGNVDGADQRPFNDGGAIIITTNTPSTKVVQTETVTPKTTTVRWTRTVTTRGAACGSSTAGGGCITDNGNRLWCMYGNNSTASTGSCLRPGNNNAYACRNSNGVSAATTGGVGCKTDSGGQAWCVFTSNAASVGTGCQSLGGAGGAFVCKPVSSSGTSVTVQPQTYTQTILGNVDAVNNTTTTTTITQVTTNGIPAAATPSVSGPTVTNVSTVSTITGDTGAPTATTTWTNGAPTTTCMASPPAAGTSAPAAGAPVTVPGTPTTTTLSTTNTAGTVTTTTTTTGGTANTLADVAQYYYVTDLRDATLGNAIGATPPGVDVTLNNVESKGVDSAKWQHMTTFTLGLGARGKMVYSSDYLAAVSPIYNTVSQTTGDFFAIKNGVTADPATGVCSWQGIGTTCTWPIPGLNGADGKVENIDDLWHAAINGRGNFYSATNAATLAASITDALAGVVTRTGTAAAANTSNPNVATGDNFDFNSTFTTSEWDGELQRFKIDLTTGIEATTSDWKAQAQLDTNTARAAAATTTVFFRDTGGTNNLSQFTYANLSAVQKAYFSLANISTLSQFCLVGASCLNATDQGNAAGAKLVDFLRGDRTNEGLTSETTKYFRKRVHLLGDIIDAEAVYVKTSLREYSDTGFATFKATNVTRPGRVYVAANDGMVHAFDSDTGAETFAYVPAFVLPQMYRLADKNYSALHRYFVDGTPTAADVFFGGAWHTILVGGQNGGGKNYYALDITDPLNVKSLWEFSDANLGFSYGNPIVNKLKDGTWVVMFTSGYNNIGDGVGRLYIVNAGTGALIRTISTGVGSATTPSGLSKITAWVDSAKTDNTALRVYGGDLLGNLWRFDVNGDIGASGYDAQLLVTLVDSSGTPQPITAKPSLGEISQTYPVVLVGTGRYLGVTDVANTQTQSFYAVKDKLNTTTYGNPRTAGNGFVVQTQTSQLCPPTALANICSPTETVNVSSSNPVNFSTDNGWFIDLNESGERMNVDPVLVQGTLRFNTNVPSSTSACTPSGHSNAYFLDFENGGAVSTAVGVASVRLAGALATRPVVVGLPDGSIVDLTRISTGDTKTLQPPIGTPKNTTRRISWRELVTD
jgi:type IV pilus assembly protein PilY1